MQESKIIALGSLLKHPLDQPDPALHWDGVHNNLRSKWQARQRRSDAADDGQATQSSATQPLAS